ncbi:MAG TPA: alpha/beta hydrolase [Solirubrobacteraceae bacterium]
MPHVLSRPRLWVERHGRGEPLLLLTGFGLSTAVFEPVLPLYTRQFEVIAFDPRGSGRSDAPLRPTSMAELAADAASVLDALDVEAAHVLGVSMGGMVAQELALRFPHRVRGLVLGATWPGGPLAVRPRLTELTALLTAIAGSARQDGRPWLAPFLFTEEFRSEHPERVAELLEPFSRHRPSAHGVSFQFWATVYHDTVSRLHEIQAPTLVAHGRRDAMAPLANARMLAERIPDAELAVLPGAHAFALEHPERTQATVAEWLDRRAPIAPGRRRTDLSARVEPLTRLLGLQIGAARTGASLVELARRRVTTTASRLPRALPRGARPRA